MPTKRKVTIAGAAGAWGDSSLSTQQLLKDGRADYIVYEGLAEITMAILSRAKHKDASQGYARDLIETIAHNLDAYRGSDMRVVTNAGGVNPHAAADVIRAADPSVSVAVVSGDDLMERPDLLPGLTGEALSANVYLGARPIATALDSGAEVVVTGRVVDSALTLGPLIHEFGWRPDELDLLSAGSLAGHLIECGPQASGGLLTDWEDTTSWVDPGYPLVEVSADGSFIVTTPDDSNGLVDVRTVSEQLLYEIGDPGRYLLPDVTCDWRLVTLEEVATNRVAVTGARGWSPPTTMKACAQISDGWRAQMLLFIGGRDAVHKARRVGRDLIERGRRVLDAAGLDDFRATHVEVIGAEDSYGDNSRAGAAREVILDLAVHHDSREAVAVFIREIPSIALAGPPGVSGGGAGLPGPTPLVRLECFPVPREAVSALVEVDGESVVVPAAHAAGARSPDEIIEVSSYDGPTITVPLVAIAHGRSGDKGADLNIGIRARHPDFYDILLRELPGERVGEHLTHLGASEVKRFGLPGIHAVNFLLLGALGAGGTASLRFDPQGKAVAQQLLDIEIEIPADLAAHSALRPL